jgi:hypothetical protein
MMKASTITILVLLAATSALAGCNRGSARTHEVTAKAASASSVAATTAQAGTATDRVVVYYFHGNHRCRTCLGIQASIEKTIAERFGAETASAALSFQEVNIDAPENKHFIQEFNLSSSSMVLTANKGKAMLKWENCEKVWEHAHDQTALAEYTEKQIRAYLDMLKRT